jgi:hypothetical protein
MATTDLDKLRADLARAQQALADAERAQADFEALSPEKQLAVHLHGKTCHWNHIDQCGWEYQNDLDPQVWGDIIRKRYLERAQELLRALDGDLPHALRVVTIIGRGV